MIENINKKQVRNDTYILNKVMNYLKTNFHKVVNNGDLYFIYDYITQSRKKKDDR